MDLNYIRYLRENCMEELAETVHNAWWKEKIQQGESHPDMKPYNMLSEKAKDLDRVAVESILNAIETKLKEKQRFN